jgi:DNA-binding NtrC family response regulator
MTHFLAVMNEQHGKSIAAYSPSVRAIFQRHDWPGNVRELKNLVERAVIFCDGTEIGVDCLPDQYRQFELAAIEDGGEGLRDVYDSVSREVILEALDRARGSRQKAAEILRINRRTLYNKMKRLNIE